MKGLTTEVFVVAYNSNSLNIIVLLFLHLSNFKVEVRAIETTMALPWRYHGGAPVVVSAQPRCMSDDPLRDRGVRGLVVALKLVASAPFRFVSDDPLDVGGSSR